MSADEREDAERIERALAWEKIEELGPLWDELARRMGASDRPVRRVKVSGLGVGGRKALAGLMGAERVDEGAVVDVAVEKVAAQFGLGDRGLRRLVERLRGPVGNRAAAREEDARAREELWAHAEARLGARVPGLLARLRVAGVPEGDVEGFRRRLDRLGDAVDRLPLSEAVPLPMFAWMVTGDPHALDPKRWLRRTVVDAAVELAGGVRFGVGDEEDGEGVVARKCLHAMGVVPDRVSAPTVTYGVRARGRTAVGRMLEAAAEAKVAVGFPAAVFDGGAGGEGMPEFADRRWLVVENPSVVEMAVLRGWQGAVVCTGGWPSVDAQRLLAVAREQGVELVYAGDYDGEGLAIAGWMRGRFGVEVAMSAGVYSEAVERSGGLGRGVKRWDGEVPETAWDVGLRGVILEKRVVVFQEDPVVWAALVGG